MKTRKFTMIAGIYDKSKLIGYKMLEMDTNAKYMVSIEQTTTMLKRKDFSIVNMKYANNAIKYVNGNIARYPRVNEAGSLIDENGNICSPQEKAPIILLKQITGSEPGYKITDFNCNIVNKPESWIINYGERYGIANGKIVNRDGHKIISAIDGTYDELDMRKELEARKAKLAEDTGDKVEPVKAEPQEVVTPKSVEPTKPAEIIKSKVIYPEYHKESKLTDYDRYILAFSNMITGEDRASNWGNPFEEACKRVNGDYNRSGEIGQEARELFMTNLAKVTQSDLINKLYNKNYNTGYSRNVGYCIKLRAIDELTQKVINTDGTETIENNSLFKLVNMLPNVVNIYECTNEAFNSIEASMMLNVASLPEELSIAERLVLAININKDEVCKSLSDTISLKDILTLGFENDELKKTVDSILDRIDAGRMTDGVKIRVNPYQSRRFGGFYGKNYYEDVSKSALSLIELLGTDLECKARSEDKVKAFNDIVGNKETYITMCDTALISGGNVSTYVKNKICAALELISGNMKG